MAIVEWILILAGYAGMAVGFYVVGEKTDRTAWAGVIALFAGLVMTFTGVLLAFAPRFFE